MVQEGKFVSIHYIGKLENGEIFDSCEENPPFEFQVGAGMVIPGLDEAVVGMKINEEKDIVINPDMAYGDYNDDMIHTVPRSELGGEFVPEIGMMVGVQMEDGSHVPATICAVSESEISIDMNHPLAGKSLHFHVKVVEVNDEPKYMSGCDSCGDSSCGSGGCSCC